MLYQPQWSRILKPFLLCKYDRGQAARNKNHVCSIILDVEQLILYNKSEVKWNKTKSDPNYTEEVHRLWAAEKNCGVSNQGIHPTLLPRSTIRPDVFYLGCAIGKRLLEYLRTFSLKQSKRC